MIGVVPHVTLSIYDLVDPSIEIVGDANLEDDYDQYESKDNKDNHEVDDLPDTKKYILSPRPNDIDETKMTISKESLMMKLFTRMSVLESTYTQILRLLRYIHQFLYIILVTPIGST